MQPIIKRLGNDSRGEDDIKRVFLTFDDGPNEIYTPRILDILKVYNIKATFFLVGRNAEKYPHIVERIYVEGHDIGNHTYSHPISPLLSRCKKEFVREEIFKTNKVIKDITGSSPRLFRPTLAPWDLSIKKLLKQAEKLGHLSIGWSYSMLDWMGSSLIVRKKIKKNHDRTGGDIILLHDGAEKTISKKREATICLLPDIIREFKSHLFQPEPLTKILF